MSWHSLSSEEVLKNLKSSEDGLTSKEAEERLVSYGKNVLRKHRGRSKLKVLLGQFNSLLIYILIIAAVLSFLIGHAVDAIVISVIVLLNASIGFIQEYKAEEIIEKLKKSLGYNVMILRGGVQMDIDSAHLVPGDIMLLESGDKVLADARVIETEELQVNEAVLTGESFPVDKIVDSLEPDTVLADRNNMIYAGTTVSRGQAKAVVVETGINTEFGKLAELVQETKSEKMPLENKVNKFSSRISIAVLILVAFVFAVGVSVGLDRIEMFLVSVSLAIGAIPEGLPAIIAITLAFAVKQMYRNNTLIRRLPAAETLGRTTIICTDKTGTLTEEELSVDKIYSKSIIDVKNIKSLNSDVNQLFKIGVLCNNARDEGENVLGDPTEVSLINLAKKFGFSKKDMTENNPKVREFPFDSNRKMMSVVREDGKIKTSYVKGAPLFVVDRCSKELIGGKIQLISSRRRKELEKVSHEMESMGLRVLGFGFRQLTEVNQKGAENHLIFTGFVGMIDPPRAEVKEAIREAVDAGIKIKVITGDSALTTLAIAKKVGLSGEVIEGKDLDKLNDKQWERVVEEKTIFARITPQQKLRVVELLKRHGETVSVTGDGVNDILALKRADIGISMGIRGSDVAKDSSDMVLLDDNFVSIIKAVRQGRRVFDNLKKSIKFLLAANLGEVLAVVIALLLGMPLIFLPLAILWMNLVTDSLPALALAVEPAGKDVMKRKPRDSNLLEGIWKAIIVAGVLMILSSLFVFNYGFSNFGIDVARTMAISSAIFFELFFSFSCKSEKSLFKTGVLNNKKLIGAVVISFALHLVALYTPLGSVFQFVALSEDQFMISLIAGLSGLVVFESWKGIRAFAKH